MIRRSLRVLLAALAASIAVGVAGAQPASAEAPPLLWEGCEAHWDWPVPVPGAGECRQPSGVVSDPESGNIYVADGGVSGSDGGARIQEFTAWGEFVRAFGWNVAPDGAPGDTAADELEICTEACVNGESGSGPGQFATPRGMALDVDQGRLYVYDNENRRLQMFDVSGPEVGFEWMIGAGVNQGPNNPGDRCSAADVSAGDACGAGSSGTEPGQFGDWPGVDSWQTGMGAYVALAPDGGLYVGDADRIQRFDLNGDYVDEVPVPGEGVQSLAVAPSGDLYVAFVLQPPPPGATNYSKPSVRRLDPDTGDVIATLPAVDPVAIATDEDGNVYVYDDSDINALTRPNADDSEILVYDAEDNLIDFDTGEQGFGFEQLEYQRSPGMTTAIATSSACGIDGADIYVTSSVNAIVDPRVDSVFTFGPPPNPGICPPPGRAPEMSSPNVTDVGVDGATANARINPHFWPDTTYRLEYGLADCDSNPCESVPAAGIEIEQVVNRPLPVSVELNDLEPSTTYYYRFVAESSGGGPTVSESGSFRTFPEPDPLETDCRNQTARIGPSAELPDCRAYERVTPADKGGVDATVPRAGFSQPLDQARADGSGLAYSAMWAFADPSTGDWINNFLALRDPQTGWSSEMLNPPRSGASFNPFVGEYIHLQGLSPDLCHSYFIHDTDNPLAPGSQPGYIDLYARQGCGPAEFTTLTTASPQNIPPGTEPGQFQSYYPRVQGFSADGSKVFFMAGAKLTSNAVGADINQIYVNSGGNLRLVSVLPSPGGSTPGSPATTNSSLGAPQAPDLSPDADALTNAVSADGSRAFWTTTDNAPASAGQGAGTGPGRIYVRLNPDRGQSPIAGGECTDPARACTIPVSGSVSNSPAQFWAADDGGGTVLFTMGGSLYSFDVETQVPTEIGTGVRGLAGWSDDLATVYFASTDVLDGAAEAGNPNLYRYEAGEGYQFIATLTDRDAPAVEDKRFLVDPGFVRAVTRKPSDRSARVTPDGEQIAFISRASLTGYDNTGANSGERATEVFHYDSIADGGSGKLSCVSCNPTGARPNDSLVRLLGNDRDARAAHIPGWSYAMHASRALSEDGKTLFFESYDVLDPRVANDKLDVYRWQAEGSGSCEAQDSAFHATVGGCLALVSTGSGGHDSRFVDASADGSDVFLHSREQLVGSDGDDLIDIYDARIDGGFAEPISPSPCLGVGCQGEPTDPPAPDSPGSTTASEGNPPEPRKPDCAKAQAKVKKAKRAVRRADRGKTKKRAKRKLTKAKKGLRRCKAKSGR